VGLKVVEVDTVVMIQREAVVSRHDPSVTTVDPGTVFAVGNGQFAFTPDVTGFQSMNVSYGRPFPLVTMSDWMWHSSPFPEGVDVFHDFEYAYLESSRGARVPYPLDQPSPSSVTNWLRANPHRLDLGQVALCARAPNGSSHRALSEADVANVNQSLSLWTGTLQSSFSLLGGHASVTTAVHPDLDAVGWKVTLSAELGDRLGVRLAFPYGSSEFMSAADWSTDPPGRNHTTTLLESSNRTLRLLRQLDYDSYEVRCDWSAEWPQEVEARKPSGIEPFRDGAHAFVLPLERGMRSFDLACLFAPRGAHYPLSSEAAWQADKSSATGVALERGVPSASSILKVSADHWRAFWRSGAFVDLGSAQGGDVRAMELERRVVLSQYLTRVHSAGSLPPQETGLAANSWFGKVRRRGLEPARQGVRPLPARP
jgi:hypothetical protein